MKRLKKSWMLAGLVAVSLGAGSIALAGQRSTLGVYVGSTQLNGILSDARASSDVYSYVAVQVQATASSMTAYVMARNASGVYKQCWTSNPQMVSLLTGVSGDGFLYAYFDAVSGMCTQVGFGTSSAYAPKQP